MILDRNMYGYPQTATSKFKTIVDSNFEEFKPPKTYNSIAPELPIVHKPRIQTWFRDDTRTIHFERELSFVSSVNFILNYVIGLGIFSSPGTIMAECGSVGMSFIMWCFCGVISLMTILPFAELSTVVPKTGSQYIYIHEAFKDFHPFFGHTPGFIYVWVNFLFLRPISYAVHSIISADYLWIIVAPMLTPEMEYFSILCKNIIGVLMLVVLGFINCHSIKTYTISQDFLVCMKMMLCLCLVLCGAYTFLSEQALELDLGFESTTLTLSQVPIVLYTGLYAYDGASTLTSAIEEIKNPERTVMRSLIMGLGLVTATYFLLNLAFLSALTPAEIISSSTVAKEFAERLLGPTLAAVVSICVSLSIVGGNLSGIFYTSRLGYAAAKEGHMLQFLCYIHKTRLTPTPAVMFQVGLSIFFFLLGKKTTLLVNSYSFALWLSYGVTMAALMILRVKRPDAHRPYKVPLAIPWAVLFISWLLVAASFFTQHYTDYIPAVIGIAVGIFTQYFFVFKKNRIRGLAQVSKILQKWLNVVPPSQ